jgi:hypothetical protein
VDVGFEACRSEVAVAINVALVCSGVLGDLVVSVLERDPGFQVVARADDPISAVRSCGGSELDALVVGTATGAITPAARELLHGGACRVVVSIARDGKRAWLQTDRHDARPLRDLSPELLLTAIHDAVAADPGSSRG